MAEFDASARVVRVGLVLEEPDRELHVDARARVLDEGPSLGAQLAVVAMLDRARNDESDEADEDRRDRVGDIEQVDDGAELRRLGEGRDIEDVDVHDAKEAGGREPGEPS